MFGADINPVPLSTNATRLFEKSPLVDSIEFCQQAGIFVSAQIVENLLHISVWKLVRRNLLNTLPPSEDS